MLNSFTVFLVIGFGATVIVPPMCKMNLFTLKIIFGHWCGPTEMCVLCCIASCTPVLLVTQLSHS